MKASIFYKKEILGSLSFYKKALYLALPVMAQSLIQTMVSLIDNFMVAGLGDVKMSGVNIAGQIGFVFLIFLYSLCGSGGIFMSQYNGAKDSEGMKQAFRFKITVTLFFSVLYTIFCRTKPEPVLALMVHGNMQSGEIVKEAAVYMRIAAFTWIPMAFSLSAGTSLREIGKVHQPLVFSAAAAFINTFFNWIFIYGNLGAPRLEAAGAAYATVIARVCEAVMFIAYLRVKKPPFYSRLREVLNIRLSLFLSILAKSGMILVSDMSWVLTESVVAALYNSRGGAEIVSGMSAGFAIANLFFVCFNGNHGRHFGSGRLGKSAYAKKLAFERRMHIRYFYGNTRRVYLLFNSDCFCKSERRIAGGYAQFGFCKCRLYAVMDLFERTICRFPYRRRHSYGTYYGHNRKPVYGAARYVYTDVLYGNGACRHVRSYKDNRLGKVTDCLFVAKKRTLAEKSDPPQSGSLKINISLNTEGI